MPDFIDRLADELVRAASREPVTAQNDPARRAVRRPRRRGWVGNKLAVSFAAMILIGGGVAAAAVALWPSQRLADGAVVCFWGTTGHNQRSQTFGAGIPSSNGESAISICRAYVGNARTGIPADKIRFVACEANRTTVHVYFASGAADQCKMLGDTPLPATYASALDRIATLKSDLLKIQDAQPCTAPSILIRKAKQTLTKLRFDGWRVKGPERFSYFPTGTGGTCGTYDSGYATAQDTVNLVSADDELFVSYAPPRTIASRLNHVEYEINLRTYTRCYTASSVRRLVAEWFATVKLQPRFATIGLSKGEGFEPASERLYKQGCVRYDTAFPLDDNQYVDVVLEAKGAPQPRNASSYPPAGAYKP